MPDKPANNGQAQHHALLFPLKSLVRSHGLSTVLKVIADACQLRAMEYIDAGHIEENNAVKWLKAADDIEQLAKNLKDEFKI
jgi:uncharacterized membrane protein